MSIERHPRTRRARSCGHSRSEAGNHGHKLGTQTRQQWHESHQENESMTTERNTETRHNRRPHRCGSHRGNREAFNAGREFGRRGRHIARRREMMMQIEEMRERIDEMERRISRLQGKTSFRGMPHFEERETRREIIRTRREGGSGRGRGSHHYGRRMHGEGRRMGRMMKRSWQDRHMDA